MGPAGQNVHGIMGLHNAWGLVSRALPHDKAIRGCECVCVFAYIYIYTYMSACK